MFTQPYRPAGYNAGYAVPRSYSSGGNYSSMSTGTTQTSTMPPQVPVGSPMTSTGTVVPTQTPAFEQSYIENILRLNLGKVGTFYMTYENNSEWNAKIFKGVLEAAGRDHIIISDPKTGVRTMLLMVNFDYATFDEPLKYSYPYASGSVPPTRGCC
ncbi:spore coat protein GerQ [Paenibacillus motobuensis]|uniref:spore coat protein GerQ n=1 Tax=Paenibacillus TaxID=44249 RepID=UPI00203BD446|nr:MULTISPECIES: spore coat protein GerQ [Paenibacillus]MCM3039297.1 spore coat protein GerQ [Paenibacillus lutimineralis]MCM3646401.1 spore coat protein GerQ [Paenibacillus motobuensis]